MTEFQQRIQAEAEMVAEMHEKGMTNREIAEATGLSYPKVCRRLDRLGINASGSMRRRIREERGEEMMFLGECGFTLAEIGERVGASPSLVKFIFADLGYSKPEARTSRNRERFSRKADAEAKKMRAMAEDGMTCAEIAAEFGVSRNTVRNRIQRAGLVRGNDWHHAQFVEEITKKAEAAGYTIIGDPTRRGTVVRCSTCGTVREITCTTTNDMPSCPKCRARETAERSERREAERAERIARKAERAEANKRRKAARRLVTILTPRTCPRCGTVFHSTRPRDVYCSRTCSDREWSGSVRHRVRKYGGEYEQGITLGKLVRRDGMRCYLCGKECDWNDRRWGNLGPDYPTIDHVIPLAKGGGHTWSNVRVACARCNSDKRDIVLERVQRGKNVEF